MISVIKSVVDNDSGIGSLSSGSKYILIIALIVISSALIYGILTLTNSADTLGFDWLYNLVAVLVIIGIGMSLMAYSVFKAR